MTYDPYKDYVERERRHRRWYARLPFILGGIFLSVVAVDGYLFYRALRPEPPRFFVIPDTKLRPEYSDYKPMDGWEKEYTYVHTHKCHQTSVTPQHTSMSIFGYPKVYGPNHIYTCDGLDGGVMVEEFHDEKVGK